jgi:two-component system, NtrC family, sensor kinase
MSFRRSLRSKLVYTFLGGSLLTVLLFSVVIKGIMNDYFQRLGAVRLQFVSEQGQRDVRTNVAIFKDAFRDIFSSFATSISALSQSGAIGDQLPVTQAERNRMAEVLRQAELDNKLSMITLVDLQGRTILRSSNPSAYGDDALMRDYSNPERPVSSIRRIVEDALAGHTVKTFSALAPQILEKEGLDKQAEILLKTFENGPRVIEVPPNTYERRGLMMMVATPVRTSSGRIVGAVIAGRLLNKDLSIVQDFQNLVQDKATIFLGDVRIATTIIVLRGENKGQIAVGTLLDEGADTRLSRGEPVQRMATINGERTLGAYEPLLDYDNKVIGAIYVGRPLALIDSINRAQEEIEADAARQTNIYIIASAAISLLLAILIATFFSKRVTARIDQLRKGAEVIEKGQLDYRLRIRSGDEIELLSKQFNSMAAKLEESYQNLERKVEERTRELKESQEAMVQQEKMVAIGQLAAGIAHELNTPLGTIIGYAHMLREDLSQQPTNVASLADVEEVIGQAGRCRDLVKNLLNFSRNPAVEKAEADINDIIRKIISLVEHDLEMKRVRLHVNLDPMLPRTKANENEIAQVILNLANNAADSMPEGGDLYVSTSWIEDTDRIRIDVHDTGCGIKETDRNRVFEPFFTTKEVGKGTGLGLSICYKIVENHMGSIEFDTVTGEGTTFRIYLPVNAEVRVG